MLEKILINTFFILFIVYFYKKTKNALHMLQLESYKNERYFKWIKNNLEKVFNLNEIILMLISAILIVLNKNLIGLILFHISYIVLILFKKYPKEKKVFVVTARIKRVFVTYVLLILISYLFIYILNPYLILIKLGIITIVSHFVVIAINIINSPIEKIIGKRFYNKAKSKLEEMPDLKVIGITGSYGKTSSKYILTTILSQKYNVLMTPESYNTTMGVVRTINEKMNSMHQIFVCEMGAKNVGDIKEICDLVKPELGLLTAIGPQHLETFKTLENVKKTKLELIDSLNEEGIAFVNYEDENIKNAKINKETVKFGFDASSDYYADNIEITEKGSTFDVCEINGRTLKIKTKLLGKHNILNITGAIAVACKLGLSDEEILAGARYIKPVPHRLEIIQKSNGLIVIDDAYNSNSSGSKMALEVLKSFKNRKKILITPGIVDLGEKTEYYNKILGNQAAESADYIILVGEKQAVPILEGIKEKRYKEDNIYIAKNLNDAITKMNEIADENSVVLLENDLPDNYL